MADDRIANWKTPVFFVLAVLLIAVASYFAGRVKGRRIGWDKGYEVGYVEGWTAPRQSDTLIIRDTLRIDRPVPVYQYVEKPVYLAVHDSLLVHVHDTTYIALERTRKGYSGEDYECEVSGVDPALEWMRVFPKTVYITSETPAPKPSHWAWGVTVGPGLLYNGQLHAGVALAAGVQYRF